MAEWKRPVRIKIGREMVRNHEEVDPEAEVLEEVAGANILNDAILEPRRESLRARRRRGAYAEVLDELDEGSDDSDLDDFWYPTCLKSINTLMDFPIFVLPGHLTKFCFFCGQIYFWINISILRYKLGLVQYSGSIWSQWISVWGPFCSK